MKSPEWAEWDGALPAELTDFIGQVQGIRSALHADILGAIAAYDDKGSWRDDGALSIEAWLSYYLGISYARAREWVQVGLRLKDLPEMSKAYRLGEISFDHLKELSSIATSQTEHDLVEKARAMDAAQVKAMCKSLRRISAAEANQAHMTRGVRFRWDKDHRWLAVSGHLPDSDGAVVEKALQRLADQAKPDPLTGIFENYDARCADALVCIASGALSSDQDGDRATVVVHVDAGALRGEEGSAETEGGPVLSLQSAQRLACDCRAEVVWDGPDGQPVGVGRKSRTVPAWLMRQIRRRDRVCRFPGCDRSHWVNAHHLRHWAQGGPTDRDNLALLCGRHHRMVHEEGWAMTGSPQGSLKFISPQGHVLKTGPPGLRGEIADRIPRRE